MKNNPSNGNEQNDHDSGSGFWEVHYFSNVKYFTASFEDKSSKFSTAWRSAGALFLLLEVCFQLAFEAFANESAFYSISIMSHFTSSVTATNFKFGLCFIICSAYTAFLTFFFFHFGETVWFAAFHTTRGMEVAHTTILKLFFIFQGIPNRDIASMAMATQGKP